MNQYCSAAALLREDYVNIETEKLKRVKVKKHFIFYVSRLNNQEHIQCIFFYNINFSNNFRNTRQTVWIMSALCQREE